MLCVMKWTNELSIYAMNVKLYVNLYNLNSFFFFFFNDTATTEIYTLSLHDALPISTLSAAAKPVRAADSAFPFQPNAPQAARSEEHTSELQSPCNLVCRLLLEKKKIPLTIVPPTYMVTPKSVFRRPNFMQFFCGTSI